jgi:hypothetical protein
MNDLEIAKARLKEGFSFCIVKDGKVTFDGMSAGIKDIYHIVTDHDIRGSSVADKIIGKAVALLLVEGGIKSAFALNINQKALDVLNERGIEVQYDSLMDRLESMCQFEKAVKDVSEPKDAINALRRLI